MKKYLLLYLLLLGFNGFSQDTTQINHRWYAGISVGYASGANTQLLGYNNDYGYSKTEVKGSFGKGPKVAIQLGYCWRRLLHFELAASYKQGISYEVKTASGWGGGSSPFHGGGTDIKWISSPQFQLLPSAKLNLGHENNPYFKVGAVINLKNKLIKDSLDSYGTSWSYPTASGYQYYNNSVTVHQITEYTKPVSLGFTIAAGLELYNKRRNFSFFFEVSYIYMKWKANKVDITHFEQDVSGTYYSPNFSLAYENNRRSACSIDIATGLRFLF